MKSSRNILALSVVICVGVLTAKHAQAGGFKFGGGSGNGGGGGSSFKINHGGNSSSQNQFKNGSSVNKFWNKNDHHDNHHNNHHNHHGHHHHHHKYYPKYHVRYVEPVHYVYSKCYHPPFQSCYVYPGDTWYTISKRIYGVDYMCKHIAAYNGMTMGSPLSVGQMLRLPVINQNGSLATSSAPMPAQFSLPSAGIPTQGTPFGPQGSPNGLPNGLAPQGVPNGLAPQGLPNGLTASSLGPQGAPQGVQTASLTTNAPVTSQPEGPSTPAANIRTVTNEPTLPRVAIGSTLALDGESLGSEKGVVRLRVSGLALPVDVIEWSETSVKIQLPKMDLSNPVKAELEVMRADGSLASKSGIELTPAATRLALGN